MFTTGFKNEHTPEIGLLQEVQSGFSQGKDLVSRRDQTVQILGAGSSSQIKENNYPSQMKTVESSLFNKETIPFVLHIKEKNFNYLPNIKETIKPGKSRTIDQNTEQCQERLTALQLVHTAQDPVNAGGEAQLWWHYKQTNKQKAHTQFFP